MATIPLIEIAPGVELPALGLGTWQLTGKECVESVRKALELGYRHIDTAEKYNNEDEIGETIKDFPRGELFITSKVSAENLQHDRLIESFNGSLSRLKTGYLDLYLVHWPSRDIPIEETFGAFKQLMDSGKIRSTGVSNFFMHHLDHAIPAAQKLELKISVNQVEFHPLLHDQKLLDYCRAGGITLTAYSPLARGKALNNGLIKEIAGKYGKTPAQISLRWEIQKGTSAIPKAARPEHLEENINIFDFELEDGDMRKIDSIPEFKRFVSTDTP